NEGGSHLPTAWKWKACSPGGNPLSESLSRTPAGVCDSEIVPTSCPVVSLSAAFADCATAGTAKPIVNRVAAPIPAERLNFIITDLLLSVSPGKPRRWPRGSYLQSRKARASRYCPL